MRRAWLPRALLLFPLTFACGRQAASASADEASWTTGDAGSCEDRARVHPICVQAVTHRCRGQVQACESSCETQFGVMPGNSDKEPGLRGDMETNACRERCGTAYSSCAQALIPACPALCAP